MNELPKPGELNPEARAREVRHGVEAIERALRDPPPPPAVEIAIYVNGRLINTKTDSDTVFRILGILTGLGQ